MPRPRPNRNHKSGRAARDDARNVGLARALSKLGHCSRREAGELVTAGHVRLNGMLLRNPQAPVRLGRDHIEDRSENVRIVQPFEKAPGNERQNQPADRLRLARTTPQMARHTAGRLLAPSCGPPAGAPGSGRRAIHQPGIQPCWQAE